MLGVALELADLKRVPIDVREETTRGLTVEAGGGDKHVAPLDLVRPGFRIELHPVVPALVGRKGCEVNTTGSGIKGLAPRFGLGSGSCDSLVETLKTIVGAHASGTTWPAWTYACSWSKSPTRAAIATSGPRAGAKTATPTSTIPPQK